MTGNLTSQNHHHLESLSTYQVLLYFNLQPQSRFSLQANQRLHSFQVSNAPSNKMTCRPSSERKPRFRRQEHKRDGIHGYCLACCEQSVHSDLVWIHKDKDLYGQDHEYCKECVGRLFQLALKNESVFPPKCCPQAKLPIKDVEKFLTQETVDEYYAKHIEYASGKRLYCSVPTCSAFIPRDQQENGTGVCPKCLTLVCVSCGSTSHDEPCQEEESFTLLLEEAGKTGWQTCKACFRIVERSAGCNKIRYSK